MACLNLFAIFHLNMAFSSIDEEERYEVIKRCYWPLLELIDRYNLPLGVEATGYTLEVISELDYDWICALKKLVASGICEFIGSGYSQIIGPLVPAMLNRKNQEIGCEVYRRTLGLKPNLALVSEQAYSAGIIEHYIDAGYSAIVMEWNNPYKEHKEEWNSEWRYFPQIACGQHGERIPVIWNNAIAFQKFQRYAHGEIELEEHVDYLSTHISEDGRVLSLYGNDAEIFDFRPGRYDSEADINIDGEWNRISTLFQELLRDDRFNIIAPSDSMRFIDLPYSGNLLHLESASQPIPVKKQDKYNITRWAVTGRDDIGINTACWSIYKHLKSEYSESASDKWKELCYLWGSDFRTHITDKRWRAYLDRLTEFLANTASNVDDNVGIYANCNGDSGGDTGCAISRSGRYISVDTDMTKVILNCRRGMAIEGLWFKNVSSKPLLRTLHHGYYDNISFGVDYYTGHLVLESPGVPKITDLTPVDPMVERNISYLSLSGLIGTPLGDIHKVIKVFYGSPCIEIEYDLNWNVIPLGSLRLGHITLNPEAFNRSNLFYSTHNGGRDIETFPLNHITVDHGSPVSFLVSASHCIGATEGEILVGDDEKFIRVVTDKRVAALVGLVYLKDIADSYLYRLILSAREMDDTQINLSESSLWNGKIRFTLHGVSASNK